jgi:hypothetical protein
VAAAMRPYRRARMRTIGGRMYPEVEAAAPALPRVAAGTGAAPCSAERRRLGVDRFDESDHRGRPRRIGQPVGQPALRGHGAAPLAGRASCLARRRTFHQRVIGAGKPKKLALTAAMRKLAVILNAISAHRHPVAR